MILTSSILSKKLPKFQLGWFKQSMIESILPYQLLIATIFGSINNNKSASTCPTQRPFQEGLINRDGTTRCGNGRVNGNGTTKGAYKMS